MLRFLNLKARLGKKGQTKHTRSGHKRQGGPERRHHSSPTVQSYVTKPLNMRKLQDPEQSTMHDLQKAMQCDWSDFDKMQVSVFLVRS